MIACFPLEVFTFVGRFSRLPSWNARLRSARAAGLKSHALYPWHDRSCRGNRQQHDGTLLRIREVPPPCCVRLSCRLLMLAERVRRPREAASIVADWRANLVLIESADLHQHPHREPNSRRILALWSRARPDEAFLRGWYRTGGDRPECCRSRTRLQRRRASICSTQNRSSERGYYSFRGRRSRVVRIHIFLGARRNVRPRQCRNRRSSGPTVDRR